MEITDIKKRLSGGAANADVALSLGGVMSSVDINEAVPKGNLFDAVSAAERAAGSTEYRCFYFLNAHPTEKLNGAGVFIQSNTPSGTTTTEIGLDPAGKGNGAATGVAAVVADETTAPAGVVFSAPSTAGAALPVGDLSPGDAVAVWIKRVVSAGTASSAQDPFTLQLTGTPGA